MRPEGARAYTILLVEDDPDTRKVLSKVLERAGYTVIASNDGNAAFRLCLESGENIDLIVTDIVLPGINGIDLVELFQAQWPQIKAILLSGQIQRVVLQENNRNLPFLQKPVTPEALLEKIREVLNEYGGGANEGSMC
jgi:two-component system, cell cycle sensor histidine kinase and response regulator CckA